MRPIIVLLGGPGSGKGTHGTALASALDYVHLSSGEHFRDHIHRETPLGLQAKEFIDRGRLVPDELAAELMQTLLSSRPDARGFVVDGYPRSLVQAQGFEAIASASECRVEQALYLVVSDDEIVRRLSGRLTCRKCGHTWHEVANPPARAGVCDHCGGELYRRKDDAPETIRERITVFHRMIEPMLEHFRQSGLLTEIPAEGSRQEVSARVIAGVRGTLS